ncbi:hypothetical protein [Streptomyces sp. MP131-18]|uniref:hypothetical protein n=1 Tax=Streptomyces sp. MP131-18 TaxID=1857892 RepID=UPI00097BEEAE|nr:hypothetical protein [Streptomyces sp. MP131-18]ONK10396.1 hypothetical protein STBA_11180 [Streptomyces sp. MP131-18]
MGVEFRVWNEGGDLLGEFDNQNDAEAFAERERKACSAKCGMGEDRDRLCGAVNPHGISVQIVEDGQDVTGHDHGQYR